MTDISGYRLLFDPTSAPPIRPEWTTAPSGFTAFARRVAITYVIALLFVLLLRHELSFLVKPLADALRDVLAQIIIHLRYPSYVTVMSTALLVAAPIVAVQTWTLFARRVFGPETLRIVSRRALLTVGGFAAGAALSHWLVFPLIWPLVPPFDVTAGPPVTALRLFNEFAALHVAIMLVGGLSIQVPALVALVKRRRVRA